MAEGQTPQLRLEAIVRGRVQGVYYRQTTVQTARALGVTGWVANLRNGNVKVVAEGTRPALDRLLAWLHTGPAMAHVDDVEADWSEATGQFAGFDVHY